MRAALFVALVFVAGCGGKDGATAPGVRPKEEKGAVPGLVELQALSQDYRTNEANAESKYTGRRVTCEGVMHRLEKLDSGDYMMSFDMFMDGVNMTKGDVYAYFPASETEKLKKLEFRSPVYFTGRCDGWEPNSAPRFIAIRDCKIDPAPKGLSKPAPKGKDPPKER
jgi:hypothetical protein